MPSPFTWDVLKPAGGDALNIGDDQIRTDKTQIRDVLRTLVPFGAPTIGWRNVQIDNDNYLVHNAVYGGATWSHDDTSLDAIGIVLKSTGETRVIFRKAAASTWATSAWLLVTEFKNIAAAVNYLQLLASITAVATEIKALGTDADIGILLTPKGAGQIKISANPLRLAADPSNVLDAVTKQYADAFAKILDRDTSATTINNSAVETTVYSFSVPGGTLGTNRALRLIVLGEVLNNNLATNDLEIKGKFGGTIFSDMQVGDIPISAARRPFRAEFIIHAAGATNAQIGDGWSDLGATIGVAGSLHTAAQGAVSSNIRHSMHTGLAIDSTAAQTLEVSAQWSAAGGISTEFVCRTAYLELL